MWPFGASKHWVNEAIAAETRVRLSVHEEACHEDRCPLCGKDVESRDRKVKGERERARYGYAMDATPDSVTEVTHYYCGTKRIRKDGKVRVVTRCLEVK